MAKELLTIFSFFLNPLLNDLTYIQPSSLTRSYPCSISSFMKGLLASGCLSVP